MEAIKRGDCDRLAAVLDGHRKELEEEAYGLIWEAAADTCSAPALQVLLSRYGHLEWTDLEDEETDEELVFYMIRQASKLGWQRVEPVLRMVIQADPSVLHSRLPSEDMPLHLALSLRPLPPMTVVRLLAPETPPEVWTATVQGLQPEELPFVWSYSSDTRQDGGQLAEACANLASLRQREEETRQARVAKQEAERRARVARQDAERQAKAAREEAARHAKLARQREAERQRQEAQAAQAAVAAERQRQQQAAHAERQRQREEAARAAGARLQTREGKVEALHDAACSGEVPAIRSLWPQLTLTREEAEDVMITAALHGRSWAGVQALAKLWDTQRHGDWCTIHVARDSGHPTPLIFALVGDQHNNLELWRGAASADDVVAIVRETMRRRPDLATLRSARNLTPVAEALVAYAPLEIIKALVPPTMPAAYACRSGNPPGDLPSKYARDLARQYPKGNQWHLHFSKTVHFLEEGLQAYEKQRAAEQQQLRKELKAAVDAAELAVRRRNLAELAVALPAVADPKLKDAHNTVLPLGGLAFFFEQLLLKAPCMEVATAIQEAGSFWSLSQRWISCFRRRRKSLGGRRRARILSVPPCKPAHSCTML